MIYLSNKERESIHAAIDFISTQIDGANDEMLAYHTNIIDNLRNIIKKDNTSQYKKIYKKELKRLLKKKSK